MKFSTFQEMTIELDPNEQTRRSLYGSFFRILSATHDFEIGASSEDLITGFAGLGLASERDPLTGSLPTFSELHFLETQGIANTIRIIVGEGQVFDDRVVFGGTNVPVEVKDSVVASVISAKLNVSVAAGAVLTLLSPNLTRTEVILTNIGAENCWINGSGAATPGGVLLRAGETLRLAITGYVRAYNPSGVSVEVAATELLKV